MTRIASLFLAATLAACASRPPPDGAATPEQAVVEIMRGTVESVFDPETDTSIDTLVYHPVCGGVAVGQFRIYTATHCIEGMDAIYVDRQTWDHTSAGKMAAVVDSQAGDLTTLRPTQALEAWIGTAAPSDGDGEFIHLVGTQFQTDAVHVLGARIDIPIAHGDSGHPVAELNLAVGVMEACDAAADGKTCLSTGGRFTPLQ